MPPARTAVSVVVAALLVAACSGDDDSSSDAIDPLRATDPTGDEDSDDADGAEQRFPDVLAAEADYDEATGTWTFEVTMSSPYDTPERYADGWRVIGPDGTVFGVHTLAHDHAVEQPFTRRQTGVEIPADVEEVTIEGRDQVHGFGGDTVTISVQTG